MTTKPDPQPEGKLITEARKRARLSGREAARRAGISEGRWRQIVNGYMVVTKGVYSPVVGAPAETIARMAQSVDVTPEQLESVGRADAAEELRKLNAGARAAADRAPDDLDRRIARMKADPKQWRRLEKIVDLVEEFDTV
ncbi:MAG TPA: helix-turn-helix transcriptional regulator [Streptosporangiaceae bacterium]|nr:helix-turn-helix transcriptional regulator [Streptosporangiaceae bacterium]